MKLPPPLQPSTTLSPIAKIVFFFNSTCPSPLADHVDDTTCQTTLFCRACSYRLFHKSSTKRVGGKMPTVFQLYLCVGYVCNHHHATFSAPGGEMIAMFRCICCVNTDEGDIIIKFGTCVCVCVLAA